jgi:hypothetical protein
MRSKSLARHVLLFPAVAVVSATLHANGATVAHWRFEGSTDAEFLDDSNSTSTTYNLSRGTAPGGTVGQATYAPLSGADPAAYALPAAGVGSKFPTSLQGGLTNAQAAQIRDSVSGTSDNYGDGYFTVADNNAFHDATFTLEAFIHRAAANENEVQVLAAHWGTSKGFAFAVNEADAAAKANGLQMWLHNATSGGGINNTYQSSLAVASGRDYYVAVVFQASSANNTSDGSVTFYLKDLTAGGTLQSETIAVARASVPNSTEVLTIGGLASGENKRRWIGLIDEMRYSDTTLTQADLLVVPEPASFSALGLGAFGLLGRRRK